MANISMDIVSKTFSITKKGVFADGKITIEDYWETFEMPLGWWGIEMYQQQWLDGLKRIQKHDKSCLISAVLNPYTSPFIEWWLLYKRDGKIYIYNEVLFEESYSAIIGDKSFTIENCYEFIPVSKVKADFPDGLQESEWVVDFND